MPELCQSCGESIASLSWNKVTFNAQRGVTRSWVMCEYCANLLQRMVLGFVGEVSGLARTDIERCVYDCEPEDCEENERGTSGLRL